MARVAIVGASGHAKVVIDAIERAGTHEVACLLDDRVAPGSRCYGYEVLGTTGELAALRDRLGLGGFFVAIGDDAVRARLADAARAACPGLAWISVIHPSAVLARGVAVGEGSVVMAGAVLNADARVGDGCIVNTRASVDHDCALEDFAAVSPGATLGGGVHVGRGAFVGIGASVLHGRRVGAHAVVGAGAVVIDDVPERAVAVGVPARVVRTRSPGERYL